MSEQRGGGEAIVRLLEFSHSCIPRTEREKGAKSEAPSLLPTLG